MKPGHYNVNPQQLFKRKDGSKTAQNQEKSEFNKINNESVRQLRRIEGTGVLAARAFQASEGIL